MTAISLPYGSGTVDFEVPQTRLAGVYAPPAPSYASGSGQALVEAALSAPVGAPPLCALARGKRRVTVLVSDHTRPVPSRLILPPMLREIRRGSPDAEITLLVATGCHRGTTQKELLAKCGDSLSCVSRVAVHDCDDEKNLITLGTLPSGGVCRINRIASEADLLVSEGFIEPHFFAGFSGGRKSVLPGVAARETVLYNHNADFIADPHARTGVLTDNPVHRDMLYAARAARLAFIVNVVLGPDRTVAYAVAGEAEAAHAAGCAYVRAHARVRAAEADIVIVSNGGYPLDQNAYQCVKGMAAAEVCVRPGGVIILAAECRDGMGGDSFLRMLLGGQDNAALAQSILARPREETVPDQWQVQILLRVLQKARVILLSGLPAEAVRQLRLIPARTFSEALALADALTGRPDGRIAVIPDGVSVIVEAQ